MTRSMTKQLVDTLQQIVAYILNKAQVEKDKGPEACQICFIFYIYNFVVVILAQTDLKVHVYFYFFRSDTLYVWISFSIEELLAFDKIL